MSKYHYMPGIMLSTAPIEGQGRLAKYCFKVYWESIIAQETIENQNWLSTIAEINDWCDSMGCEPIYISTHFMLTFGFEDPTIGALFKLKFC